MNELGGFATLTNGVIFHNTLASSDYGFLAREVFDPRPNYFAVLLWNRLMGTTVFDTKEEIREGAHVFAHSRKDGKDGVVYLVIDNSFTESTTVELPKDAVRYTLAGENGNMRATVMTLNDRPLVLGEGNTLPSLEGKHRRRYDRSCTGNLYILCNVIRLSKSKRMCYDEMTGTIAYPLIFCGGSVKSRRAYFYTRSVGGRRVAARKNERKAGNFRCFRGTTAHCVCRIGLRLCASENSLQNLLLVLSL